MKTFSAEASGYIDDSLSEHIREIDHKVVALTRSKGAMLQLGQLGFEMLLGHLDDVPALGHGVMMIDTTIHAADADHPESVQTPMATLAELRSALFT